MRIVRRNRMLIWVIAAACMASCARQRAASPELERDLVHLATNSVEIVLRAGSPVVRLDKDLFLTLETKGPGELDLSIPPAIEFVEGFVVRGEFDELPVKHDGTVTRRRRVHLSPRISANYRIGPIPLRFVDRGRNPAVPKTIEIPAVPLPVLLPVAKPPRDIVVVFRPVGRSFSLFGRFMKAAPALAVALVVVLLALYMRKTMGRGVAPLSSREEALKELRALMDLDLLATGRIEEFYRAITEIVRRYIEQTHSIMAPEQTTEELLAAIGRDARFDAGLSESLARFFHDADFVKFAAGRPGAETVTEEIGLARKIIEKG